ncbi:MAG: hypothetical protein JWQ14_2653 [Adhaeribacter sp.]|nr:hypothetical protein [Adhaeribacter sp.]
MKKLIFTFALLVQTAFAFADNGIAIVAQARQENVKMYQQPGTAATVLKSLSTQDKIEVVRKFNEHWTIVMVDEQVGYVLHSEIAKPLPLKTLAAAKTNRKTE